MGETRVGRSGMLVAMSGVMRNVGWIVLAALAACDGGETDDTGLRAEYAASPTVTVDGLSFDIYLALAPGSIYAAGSFELVRIDRATSRVVDLVRDGEVTQIHAIAGDDAFAYAAIRGEDGMAIERIPAAGGVRDPLAVLGDVTVVAMSAHGGRVYAAIAHNDTGTQEVVAMGPGEAPAPLGEVDGGLRDLVAAEDGVYVATTAAVNQVVRLPYDGGAPEVVQVWPDAVLSYYLAADASGVYWSLELGTAAPGGAVATRLFARPYGGATAELPIASHGIELGANDLGVYWVDYDTGHVRGLAHGATTASTLVEATGLFHLAADDGGLVYGINDGVDLGDLRVQVLPRR